MSFWRKLNKVVFYVMLVIFILAWLVFTVWGFTWDYLWWWGFIIFGGGLIVIPASFTLWGIMLEFVDNVAAIRQKVCSDQGQQMTFQPAQNVQSAQPGMTAPAMMNMQQNVVAAPSAPAAPVMQMPNYGTAPVAPVAPVASVAPVAPVAPVNGKWTCINCAKENDAISKFCHNCGSPRI